MGYWETKRVGGTRNALSPKPMPNTGVGRPPLPDRSSPPSVPAPLPKEETVCPSCGSVNYGGPVGATAKRCFTCGYNESQRAMNSTRGDPGIATEGSGAAKPAKQVATEAYNPQNVIGRVE